MTMGGPHARDVDTSPLRSLSVGGVPRIDLADAA